MPDLDDLINSEALETKIDDRARKVFFKSVTNIKLIANPLAVIILVLVGFVFTELNTSVKTLNSSLVLLSGELKDIRDMSQKAYHGMMINKEAIVRLVDQNLISNYK